VENLYFLALALYELSSVKPSCNLESRVPKKVQLFCLYPLSAYILKPYFSRELELTISKQ